MTLGQLRRALLSTRYTLGRSAAALFAVAFLVAALPGSQWHSHAQDGAVHEHTAFDGPESHEAEPAAHHPEEIPGSEGSASLHFHDSNHSLSAVGFMAPPAADVDSSRAKLPAFAVVNPPHSVFKPLYRPPIA